MSRRQLIIPPFARDSDGVAEHTPNIAWYNCLTVVEALDTLTPALTTLDELALRIPVQAIYKFDDRRIVAGPDQDPAISLPVAKSHHARR